MKGKQEDRRSTKKKSYSRGRENTKEDGRRIERLITKQRNTSNRDVHIQRQQKRAEVSLPADPAAFGVCF